jgi:hypothetical protein
MRLLYIGVSGVVTALVLARIFWPAPQPARRSRVASARRSR